jgi:hypothetical protein
MLISVQGDIVPKKRRKAVSEEFRPKKLPPDGSTFDGGKDRRKESNHDDAKE